MENQILPGHLPPKWQFLTPWAIHVGCGAIGICAASPIPQETYHRFYQWITSPLCADLNYLQNHLEERRLVNHPNILQDATVVLSAAFPIGKGTIDHGVWQSMAAHARGRDYHKTLKSKLRLIADKIQKTFPLATYRIFVDSAPVMERTWAVLAGLGSIGKNGMLLVPGIGPKVLLGEIVIANVAADIPINAPQSFSPAPAFSACKQCRRCIDACPTNALLGDGTLDAARCLSYLTIEKELSSATKDAHRSKIDTLFGCDRCQDVCPQSNRTKSALERPAEEHLADSLLELINMAPEELQQRLAGTSLYRTGAKKIQENATVALQNTAAKSKKS